jgi:hypothetical protein
MGKLILIVIAVVVLAGLAFAYWTYRQANSTAEAAMASVLGRAKSSPERFDRAMLNGMPEIAQRYFRHAIAPGTMLHTTAQLEMEGSFLLGSKESHQTFAMTARQILAPPHEFVWMARMQSGLMLISGSDALVDGVGWTRFGIAG